MLLDSTLREGEQSFGTYMTLEDKRVILEELVYLGVEEIEVGYVGQEGLSEVYAQAKKIAPTIMHTVWSRCTPEDVTLAARAGFSRVHVGVPVSELHRSLRLDCSHSALIERLTATMIRARECGIRMISVGLEDASRASQERLMDVARYACELGASRLRLSDTVGRWTPDSVSGLVREVKALVSVPVGVHCHNDLGMATANSVVALQAGAAFADCSVLGMGERSGIAKLEELVTAINELNLKGDNRRYRGNRLQKLCMFAGQVAGISIPRYAPVIGQDIFAVESGLHAHGVSKNPDLFEPFSPETTGHSRTVNVGRKSGRAVILSKIRELELSVSTGALSSLVDSVRKTSEELSRPLSDKEFASLCAVYK